MVDLESASGCGGYCLQVTGVGADYEITPAQSALDYARIDNVARLGASC
jgi:hypothetical protein